MNRVQLEISTATGDLVAVHRLPDCTCPRCTMRFAALSIAEQRLIADRRRLGWPGRLALTAAAVLPWLLIVGMVASR